jgi:hypothetical protein
MHFRKLFFGRFLPRGGDIAVAWTLAQMTFAIIQAGRALARDKQRLQRLRRLGQVLGVALVVLVVFSAGLFTVWLLKHSPPIRHADPYAPEVHFFRQLVAAPWPYWLLPVLGVALGARKRGADQRNVVT